MDKNSDSANVAATSNVTETLPPLSVGKILSEARARQGLSVADVAASIKFAPRQVEALEADDFGHLPELAFVRGFVRSYARLLHIDETSLLAALPPAHQVLTGLKEDLPEVPFSSSQSNRRVNVAWIAAAAALAAVVGMGLWLLDDKPEPKKVAESYVPVTPVPVVQPPVVSQVAAASPVAAALPPVAQSPAPVVVSLAASAVTPSPARQWAKQGPIHLVFEAEAWVDIKDNTGKTLLKQVNPQGTERWLRGEPPFSLVIGNASSVRLYYEGEEVDLSEFASSDVARLTLVE